MGECLKWFPMRPASRYSCLGYPGTPSTRVWAGLCDSPLTEYSKHDRMSPGLFKTVTSILFAHTMTVAAEDAEAGVPAKPRPDS